MYQLREPERFPGPQPTLLLGGQRARGSVGHPAGERATRLSTRNYFQVITSGEPRDRFIGTWVTGRSVEAWYEDGRVIMPDANSGVLERSTWYVALVIDEECSPAHTCQHP